MSEWIYRVFANGFLRGDDILVDLIAIPGMWQGEVELGKIMQSYRVRQGSVKAKYRLVVGGGGGKVL